MKSFKVKLSLAVTIIIVVSTCLYIMHIEKIYSQAVNIRFSFWEVSFPVIGIIYFLNILKGEKGLIGQEKWGIYVFFGVTIVLISICIFKIYKNPYDFKWIMGIIIVISADIMELIAKNKKDKSLENVVMKLGALISGIYVTVGILVFSYINIVNPITLSQAEEIISEKYQNKECFFIEGKPNYEKEKNPLGTYYFYVKDETDFMRVHISVLDGSIIEE